MELYASQWASVSLNTACSCMELIWKRESASEKYREVLNKIVEAKLKVTSLLSDISKLGIVAPADRLWMELHLLPQAVEGGLENIAMVVPDEVFSQKHAMQVKQAAKRYNLNIQHFTDIETAREWLSQYNPQKPLSPAAE